MNQVKNLLGDMAQDKEHLLIKELGVLPHIKQKSFLNYDETMLP
jgi:hypothetical protein